MPFAVRYRVTRRYAFSAGHLLPFVPPGHKCGHQHGHNYKLDVHLTCDELRNGFVIDFFDLDSVMHPLIKQCDHKNLQDDVPGLSNPTAELIAAWFLSHIDHAKLTAAPSAGAGLWVTHVVCWEEDDCYALAENVGGL